MTHSNSRFAPRRISERVVSVAGAIVVTALMFMAPDARAADSPSQADGIAVQFSQATLNSPEDAARLYRKLKLASKKVCGLGGGFLNLPERTRANRCYEETLADVVRKIDRPLLTSLHAAQTSKVG
jgi:UrcA family protein